MTPEMVPILKLHKRWADRYTLLWQLFVLALLAGLEFILSYMASNWPREQLSPRRSRPWR